MTDEGEPGPPKTQSNIKMLTVNSFNNTQKSQPNSIGGF